MNITMVNMYWWRGVKRAMLSPYMEKPPVEMFEKVRLTASHKVIPVATSRIMKKRVSETYIVSVC